MPIRSLQALSAQESLDIVSGNSRGAGEEILTGGIKKTHRHCWKDCGHGINSEDSMLNKFGKKTNPNR